jgi:hypothetical protein
MNQGTLRRSMAMAVRASTMVTDLTGHEVHTWSAEFSPQVGEITWSAWFEHLSDLGAVNDVLASSEAYLELIESSAGLWVGQAVDGMIQIIHASAQPTEVPMYASVVRADIDNGAMDSGLSLGVELAETAERVTGRPATFGAAVTGSFNGVVWITGFPDLQAMETTQAKLAVEPAWHSLLDRAGSTYRPGATTTVYRRLT